ncbi:hypothetical protein KFE25_003805 [Diacronema lutheri]|uniref:MORN repeat-containing protein 5 n=1 Tax=Diacronema lutheri TaxID=2081491 RepID=A0A8J5XL30_DIALT|nr:hypothetical protein KFE25_003805 [Diacronema lutheri]
MDYSGSVYEGGEVRGRIEGQGKYLFPSGTTYVGEFKDGEFHGKGMLIFKDCGKFTGTWERGAVVAGEYAFRDGLPYEDNPSWSYCDGVDRTFFRERVEGLRPAGDEQLTNEHPVRDIPKGCYDIGRGYYNPVDGLVYNYSDGALIGGLYMGETEAWVKATCRVG